MIDVSDAERSPAATLEILQDELSSFGPDLATKRSLVILTKCELIDSEALQQAQAELAAVGHEALVISAVTGQGLTALKDRLYALVSEIKMQSALTAEPAESYESPSNPY
jgi:GTPase involved in cell partitioning and DNA repair